MNTDIIDGSATKLRGKLKETVGSAIGDRSLQGEGVADQAGGTVQKTIGQARDVVGDVVEDGVGPIIDQLRRFARERPVLATLVGGVIGLAILNTLRGK